MIDAPIQTRHLKSVHAAEAMVQSDGSAQGTHHLDEVSVDFHGLGAILVSDGMSADVASDFPLELADAGLESPEFGTEARDFAVCLADGLEDFGGLGAALVFERFDVQVDLLELFVADVDFGTYLAAFCLEGDKLGFQFGESLFDIFELLVALR